MAGSEWAGREHGEVFKPPPLEDPSWSAFLHDGGGLVIQLVRVAGLNAGELLRLRSATHALDVTAGSDGGAVVPVMLPLLAAVQPALLVRADGRSLKGHVAVSSAVFERRFTLPGSLRSGPTRTRSGNTLITTKAADGDVVHLVTALGAVSRSATRAEAGELNPQPLPPVEVRDRELAERAGIHGVDRIIAVPRVRRGRSGCSDHERRHEAAARRQPGRDHAHLGHIQRADRPTGAGRRLGRSSRARRGSPLPRLCRRTPRPGSRLGPVLPG